MEKGCDLGKKGKVVFLKKNMEAVRNEIYKRGVYYLFAKGTENLRILMNSGRILAEPILVQEI